MSIVTVTMRDATDSRSQVPTIAMRNATSTRGARTLAPVAPATGLRAVSPIRGSLRPGVDVASELYKAYEQYSKLETQLYTLKQNQRGGNNVEQLRLLRAMAAPAGKIGTISTELEGNELAMITRHNKKVSGPTARAIDYRQIEKPYHDYFFNPALFALMRGVVREITKVDSQNSAEHTEKIRHWITNLKTISSGSFGKTMVAGLNEINEFLVLKFPLTPESDQLHEYLVGLRANQLRESGRCVNVIYVYDYFKCGGAKVVGDADKGVVSSWCTPDSGTEYIVMENVYNIGTLASFLYKKPHQINLDRFISMYTQQVFTIKALNEIGITHWDSHLDNWLARKVEANSVVKFDYRGRELFVKTGGVVPTNIDFGLSSFPIGDNYIGPNLKMREGTSCYFSGSPFPFADIYRITMDYYDTVLQTYNGMRRQVPEIDRLLELLERIIVDFFHVESAPYWRDLRGRMLAARTDKDYASVYSILRPYNFRRLDQSRFRGSVDDFINMLVDNGGLYDQFRPRWNEIVDIREPAPTLKVLSCGQTSCSDTNSILNHISADPRDYFDVDLYKIDIKTLRPQVQNAIVDNTLNIIDRHVREAKRVASRIPSPALPPYPEYLDNVEPYLDVVEKRADDALVIWHAEGELDFLKTIVYDRNLPGAREIKNAISSYEGSRNVALFDELNTQLTEALTRLQVLADDESLDYQFAQRIDEAVRGLKLTIEALSNSPLFGRRPVTMPRRALNAQRAPSEDWDE